MHMAKSIKPNSLVVPKRSSEQNKAMMGIIYTSNELYKSFYQDKSKKSAIKKKIKLRNSQDADLKSTKQHSWND